MHEVFIASFNLVTLCIIPPSLFQLGGCELWDHSPILTQLIKSVVLVPSWRKYCFTRSLWMLFKNLPKSHLKNQTSVFIRWMLPNSIFPHNGLLEDEILPNISENRIPQLLRQPNTWHILKTSLGKWECHLTQDQSLFLKFSLFSFERGIKWIHHPTPSH